MMQFPVLMPSPWSPRVADEIQSKLRNSLPGFVRPTRDDGSLVKPLVGNPQPGEYPHMPHVVPVSEAAMLPVTNATSYRCNRTMGYQPSGAVWHPSTPHGIKKTDATDWALDGVEGAKVAATRCDPLPPSSAEAKAIMEEFQKRLRLFRALRAPPHCGKSLAPQLASRGGKSIEELMVVTKPLGVNDRLHPDPRPAKIRAAAVARGKVKIARKALRARIDRIPVPEWNSGSMGCSSKSTAYLVPNLWNAFLEAGREHGGRIEPRRFEELLISVGVKGMSGDDVSVLFQALDMDHSGG